MQGKRRSSATLALCHIYGMLAGCRVPGWHRLCLARSGEPGWRLRHSNQWLFFTRIG